MIKKQIGESTQWNSGGTLWNANVLFQRLLLFFPSLSTSTSYFLLRMCCRLLIVLLSQCHRNILHQHHEGGWDIGWWHSHKVHHLQLQVSDPGAAEHSQPWEHSNSQSRLDNLYYVSEPRCWPAGSTFLCWWWCCYHHYIHHVWWIHDERSHAAFFKPTEELFHLISYHPTD